MALTESIARKDEIGTGEENRIGPEWIGTDEDRTEGWSQDSDAWVNQCGSPSSPTYTVTCLRSKLCSLTS